MLKIITRLQIKSFTYALIAAIAISHIVDAVLNHYHL